MLDSNSLKNKLVLIDRVNRLLDLVYSEVDARKDQAIQLFRDEVLQLLLQLSKENYEDEIKVLTAFANQLTSIWIEAGNQSALLQDNIGNFNIFNINANNLADENAKLHFGKNKIVLNPINYHFNFDANNSVSGYLQQPSPSSIRNLGSMPSLLEDFTGRTKEIEAINAALRKTIAEPTKNNVSIFVISGTNGVGKTSLARKLVADWHTRYKLVAWIDASPERIYDDFCILGKKLHVDLDGKSIQSRIADIHEELTKYSPVLLVFDGAKNKDSIHKYFPQEHLFQSPNYCHCLVTSNQRDKSNKYNFDLNAFEKIEAKKYIKWKLEKIAPKLAAKTKYDIEKKKEENDIDKLIEKLDAFPLALAQALAFIEQKGGCSINQYLKALKNNQVNTLSNYLSKEENYEKTVMTTWEITMRMVNQQNKLAEKLLEISAYLYAGKISREFLHKVAQKQGFLEKYDKRDSIDPLQEALYLLYKYSLITKLDSSEKENSTHVEVFRIHLLLQYVIRVKIMHKDNSRWNIFDFPNANRRRILWSIDTAITEVYESKLEQNKLEVASHWEAITASIDELGGYRIIGYTSVLDYFNIKNYRPIVYFLIMTVHLHPIFYIIFSAIFFFNDTDFTSLFKYAGMSYSVTLPIFFGTKFGLRFVETSIAERFFFEYYTTKNNFYASIISSLPTFIWLSLLNFSPEILNPTKSWIIQDLIFSFYWTIMATYQSAHLLYTSRDRSLSNVCQKTYEFSVLFFNGSQFDKAIKNSTLGLNLLKALLQKDLELEAKFHELLGDIYYQTSKEDKAHLHYQESLKKLKDSRKNNLKDIIDRIEQKLKKIKPPLLNSRQGQSSSTNVDISNSNTDSSFREVFPQSKIYKEKSNVVFFANEQPVNPIDIPRSMLSNRKNNLKTDIGNKVLQEVQNETGKLKIP